MNYLITKYLQPISIAILIFVAAVLLLHNYKSDISITTDSGYYSMAASNIAQHNGFSAFNMNRCGEGAEFVPITYYDPFYPYVLSAYSSITSTPYYLAARQLNYLCWIVFFGLMSSLAISFFKSEKWFATVFIAFLVFSSGLYTYNNAILTESLFLCILSLLCTSIYKLFNTENKKYVLLLSIATGSLASILLLTRKAGAGFVVGIFVVLIWKIFSEKKRQNIFQFLIFSGTFLLIYGCRLVFLYIRTGTISQSAAAIHHRPVHLFGIKRFIQGISYFFTDAMAFPAGIEKIAFLALIPLVILVLYVYLKRRGTVEYKSNLNFAQFVFWSLLIYLSSVIYGSFSNPYNRDIGYMRFYYLAQPFTIFVLLWFLRILKVEINFKKLLTVPNTLFVIIVLILSLSMISGINRNRILYKTVTSDNLNQKVEKSLQNITLKNNILASNHWAKVVACSKKPCLEIGYNEDIREIITCYKKNIDFVYLFLFKDIGVTYRIGVPKWNEILEGLEYDTIDNDQRYILVKLHKVNYKADSI